MKILAHRGHWREPSEKNGFAAFERAWDNGHGIETDLRDLDGRVVVSHDPPLRGALDFEAFLEAYAARGNETPLALNIKADGLCSAAAQTLVKHKIRNFFVFDMSVPDSLHYLRAGLPVFLRLSEYESQTSLFDRAVGVWLDAFEREWWTSHTVRGLHAAGKMIAIVSSELHGRPHSDLWRTLQALDAGTRDDVMLCTDFPDEAARFFAR